MGAGRGAQNHSVELGGRGMDRPSQDRHGGIMAHRPCEMSENLDAKCNMG